MPKKTPLFTDPIREGDFVLIQRPDKPLQINQIQKIKFDKVDCTYQCKIKGRWISRYNIERWVKACGSKEAMDALEKFFVEKDRKERNGNVMGLGEILMKALNGGLIASQRIDSIRFGRMDLKAKSKGKYAGMTEVIWKFHVKQVADAAPEESK